MAGSGRGRAGGPRNGEPSLAPLVDGLLHDLRYAVRGLARSPGFTAVAVATLTLGVGANGAAFSVVDRLFGQPPAGLSDPDAVRRLYLRFPNNSIQPGLIFPSWSYRAFVAVDGVTGPDTEVAAWTPSSERPIRVGVTEMRARLSFVTDDFFSVVGVAAERGRFFAPEEGHPDVPAPVAVVSHAFWDRGLGRDADVLGRTLEFDGTVFTIVGVSGFGFAGLDLSYADVFLPLSAFPVPPTRGTPWYEQTGNYLRAVARLSGEASEGPFTARATAAYHARQPPPSASEEDASVLAGSIIETRGPGAATGSQSRNAAVTVSTRTLGVTAIVLLIACANVAGLLLVRASRRRREVAVRLAIGISRGRLVRQLLTEGLVLAVPAGALGVALAWWGGGTLRRTLLPDVAWAGTGLGARAAWLAAVTAALVGIVAALAPALQSRRFDVARTLKAGSRGEGRTRGPLRVSLLVVQAALSLVLLVGAALFVQSLDRVTSLRLGFARDSVAYLRLPLNRIDQVDGSTLLPQMVPQLERITGVVGVALASFAPMMGSSQTGVWVLRSEGMVLATPYPRSNAVAPGFFDVAGVRILQGRGFIEGETTGVLIVDETMATTLWPGADPVGQCVVIGRTADGPCRTVIGVAEDQHDSQVLEDAMPRYFLPLSEESLWGTVVMRVDPRAWSDVSASVREIAASYLDAQTFDLNRVTDRLEPQYRTWRLGARLFGVFGLLALLVTVVGVYGVMAYVVSERTHEMGVRIALGARLADLLRLVVGDGLRVVVLGCLVGIAFAMALGRLVASLLYEVTPRDPTAMLGAVATLLVAGVAATLVPAIRAARVDPQEVLRQD